MERQVSDTYNQLIDRRFEDISRVEITAPSGLNSDFYMDLLCVFHEPSKFSAEDFFQYSIEQVLLYLRQTHQYYLSRSFDEIDLAITSMTRNTPEMAPLQRSLEEFFSTFKTHLIEHIQEEEEHLFPYVDALAKAKDSGQFVYDLSGKVKLIDFLLHHSDDMEEELSSLVSKLGHVVEDHADSFAFRMLVSRLAVLELDLRIHGRIEEEVLMPLALKLEESVLKAD
ncbi:MAG: hypothetical protein AAGA85_13690 [Bacteroidota bacterium]